METRDARRKHDKGNAPRFSPSPVRSRLNTNEMQNRLFGLIGHFHLTIRSQILIRRGFERGNWREKIGASIFKRVEIAAGLRVKESLILSLCKYA